METGSPGKTGCDGSAWPVLVDLATFLPGSFDDQCINHDRCYHNCAENKTSCDVEFRDMMYSECNDYWETLAGEVGCKALALAKYDFVRTSGNWSAVYAAARSANSCLP
jgi:Group XII secretory phospholipase A2 precursor (PLA2G12)